MLRQFTDSDADPSVLEGKTIAVFGYGNQGSAQAQNLRDSGVNVLIGAREGGNSAIRATEDGFTVVSFQRAAEIADIIHFLLPDEVHGEVFLDIEPYLTTGKSLCFSHGLNIHFNLIAPSRDLNVFMVSPKGPGVSVREEYVKGRGLPALIAVHQDASGEALSLALAIARANGFTRSLCLETTFRDETETDLFGEQNVLCGGASYLVKAGFDVLVEAGYPPEIAYFECVHELKLIADLIHTDGIAGMSKKISTTALFGQIIQGERLINEEVKNSMREQLERIRSGQFAHEWIEREYRENRCATITEWIKQCETWQVERVGSQVRHAIGFNESSEDQ